MAGRARTPEKKLSRYNEKRDFAKTPEPAGGAPTDAGAMRFVVQRHRATRLHYDFRLEVDGVLVSWAVPKGPTLDPDVRRGAFHVEDHPIEYIGFEGVIPRGEYGGGDVIVWDTGTYEYLAKDKRDAARSIADGEIHIDMHGQKLAGVFVLVRTRTGANGKEDWLLLHKHDEAAVPGWNPEEHPESVLSGRTNDQVQADPERLWHSDLPADEASVALKNYIPEASREAITELNGMKGAGTWHIFDRGLRVTNLDKELFPGLRGKPITKRDFLRYAAQIAPVLTPYLAGRALNLHRYPGGVGTEGFWHKELPTHAPEWLPRWKNPDAKDDDSQTYLVVDEPAALIWAANFGALEWHPWTSLTSAPNKPTYALIDIDPGEKTTWDEVLTLARLHRTALEHLHVRAFPKVTGKRGVQIWIPITPGPSFTETRNWVKTLSESVGAVVPELVSWAWGKSDRSGLARLDYTQNAINRTLVAPYSCRPAPGAPVSMPITWDELDDPKLRPDGFRMGNVVKRLRDLGDPFRAMLGAAQELPDLG